jgi:hypothetical protein
MRTCTFGVVTAVVLVSVGLLAQEAPKPAPEMSQLAFFEGSWTCQGKVSESPMGPAGEMQTSADIKKDLNGFFQSGTIRGTMKGQPPMEGRFHVTYDQTGKQFVMMWVDNFGGWAQNMSTGWKGDTMVYTGDAHMGPMTMKTRDTFTRSAGGTMKHMWEAEMNGKWTTLGEETCKKK